MKRALLSAVFAVALFVGLSPNVAAVAAEAPVVPNATGLMGSKPPAGDPLKLGSPIMGDPHASAKAKSLVTGLGKSVPPMVNAPTKLTPAGTFYKYAVGKQTPATPPSGVSDTCTVAKPYINPTYDWHTLCEVAVQSADEQQIVEIGWTRDMATYGDNNVHLFVYHWVNGVDTCYDGCGYVDYATNTTTYAGMSLEGVLQTDKIFAIERTANAWWLGYDGQWIGSMPDTIWTGATPSVTTFKQANLVQFFGEVAVGTDTASCADMGAGPTMHVAGTTGAAAIKSVTYSGQPTSSVGLLVGSTAAQWPSAYLSGTSAPYRSFSFGGGGYC
jgi:neprosin-like protein